MQVAEPLMTDFSVSLKSCTYGVERFQNIKREQKQLSTLSFQIKGVFNLLIGAFPLHWVRAT